MTASDGFHVLNVSQFESSTHDIRSFELCLYTKEPVAVLRV